jgi:hypothetical protein
MEFHKIIANDDELKDFLSKFAPRSKSHVAILQLIMREKYSEVKFSGKASQNVSTRVLSNDNVQNCYRKIFSMQAPVGSFTMLGTDIEFPNGCSCLYMTINPRDPVKAMIKVNNNLVDHITNLAYLKDSSYMPCGMINYVYSAIHGTVYEKTYVDLDIDTKDEAFMLKLKCFLLEMWKSIEYIIETRGGYHILMSKSNVTKTQMTNLYAYSKSTEIMEENRQGKMCKQTLMAIISDPMLPVAGTFQGGFVVKNVDIKRFFTLTNLCNSSDDEKEVSSSGWSPTG